MADFGRFIKLNTHWLLLLLFLILFAFFSYIHFSMDAVKNPKVSSFVGGLSAAFLVASVQFLVQLYEQIKLSKFREHGIKEFLAHRSDRKTYGEIISSAKKGSTIKVLGVTASRMLQDFADYDEQNSQELIRALERGVKVNILLPKIAYLAKDQCSDLVNKTLTHAMKLKEKFPSDFEIKFFNSPPSHSIFLSGDVCLIGPVFDGKQSRNTPTIIFDSRGSYVAPYLESFDRAWEEAGENHE